MKCSGFYYAGIAVLIFAFAIIASAQAAEEGKDDVDKGIKEEKEAEKGPVKKGTETEGEKPVEKTPEPTVLATVNGEPIKSDEVDLLYKRMEGRIQKKSIIQQLAQRKAVGQFLDKEKIMADEKLVDEEIDKMSNMYKERGLELKDILGRRNITEEEFKEQIGFQVRLRTYLESQITDEQVIEDMGKVKASHILVPIDKDLADKGLTDEEAKKKITEIEKELRECKDLKGAFAEAAKEHSTCPSKAKGGDLGFFTRHQMVPPFSDAAFSMMEGQMSAPVLTKFGYHLILVTEKKPLLKEEYEAKKEMMKAQYLQMKTMIFVNELMEKADIVIIEEKEAEEKEDKTGTGGEA